MYQLSVPVGGLGIVMLSRSVSRFAYHLPGIVWLSIGFDEKVEFPGRR